MIYRSRTGNNFTIINNHALRNVKLTWKAKGLLTYLMSLPEDWKITLEDLKNRSKDQIDATRTAITELIQCGYCFYRKCKDESGRWSYGEYFICDEPIFINLVPEFPDVENPHVEKPDMENPMLLNTILSKYFNIKDNIEQKELFKLDIIRKREKLKSKPNGAILFDNSPVAELEKFKEQINDDIFLGVNIEYYFNLIKNWANSKSIKKNDWVAYSKNWIMKDIAGKKAIMMPISNQKYITGYE